MLLEPIRTEFEMAGLAIDEGPIYPAVTAAEIRDYLARYDFQRGLPLEEVAADVESMLRRWQVQVTHPRYFGLFNPSVTLSSVVADALAATYNPQLASWRTSPAANELERHTLAWLAGKFRLPSESVATFTNGGAEANVSAVIAALTHAFPAYGDKGLQSLTEIPTIYLSAEAHHSFNKIAHMTGLGRSALRTVSTDSDLKMDLTELAAMIEIDRKSGLAPFMIIGTAGTTAAGAIDPLLELGSICRYERLWFHVDAAWGGAAIVSASLRHHLAGIESADSITCDAHKWFSVAMGCGMFFCRHPEVVRRAFGTEAAYMPSSTSDTTFDPYMNSVQWSRRFIGLSPGPSRAQRGVVRHANMIAHPPQLGDLLRESLTAAGWRVVNSTPLPVVCFTRDGLDLPAFLEALRKNQIAWMSEARIAGSPVLRACITSFKTTESDLRDVVREITKLAMETTAALGSSSGH